MPTDGSFKFESVQDLESILPYLDALRDGLAKGRLRLVSKDREVVLEPRGIINFDVEARRKGNRLKLQLKLSWKAEEDPDLGEDAFQVEAG